MESGRKIFLCAEKESAATRVKRIAFRRKMPGFDEITDYCLNKKGAWADFPFGSETLVLKVGKHYFCTLSVVKGRNIMTVKCTPEEGLRRRREYPEWVTRGYHCPSVRQPYNNTVFLDGEVPESVIFQMIDVAYEYNLKSLQDAKERSSSGRRNNKPKRETARRKMKHIKHFERKPTATSAFLIDRSIRYGRFPMTALMRRTPEEEDCSFTIRKPSKSAVFAA